MTRFASDIATIRDHALLDMADGPVTQAYVADLSAVITMLNDVLATELVCWLRYQQHAIVAAGIDHKQIAEQFADHAREELQHALSIAARINQLGGSPDFDPSSLEENLIGERIVIQTYQQIIRWLGADDPTTRRLVERILEQEEEHAGDLRDLLARPATAGG
jgi:bacterioferritin